MEEFRKNKFFNTNGLWVLIILAVIIVGAFLFQGWGKALNKEIDGMTTITGYFSCLPFKDGSLSDVATCTLGVRSRKGDNYALDVSRIQDANTDLKAEDTIAVTGTLLPSAEILASEWARYNIRGVIKVNTLLRTR